MSERVFQRWPDGLKAKVAAVAGEREVTRFTVEALEAALGSESGTAALSRGSVGEMAFGVTLRGSGDDGADQAGSIPASMPGEPVVATAAQSTVPPASPRASEPSAAVRRCERCAHPVSSPTLSRCSLCNGRIVPPPA